MPGASAEILSLLRVELRLWLRGAGTQLQLCSSCASHTAMSSRGCCKPGPRSHPRPVRENEAREILKILGKGFLGICFCFFFLSLSSLSWGQAVLTDRAIFGFCNIKMQLFTSPSSKMLGSTSCHSDPAQASLTAGPPVVMVTALVWWHPPHSAPRGEGTGHQCPLEGRWQPARPTNRHCLPREERTQRPRLTPAEHRGNRVLVEDTGHLQHDTDHLRVTLGDCGGRLSPALGSAARSVHV